MDHECNLAAAVPNTAIAVLAGGSSRRMGRDKAEIEVDGAPLLERIVGVSIAVLENPALVHVVGRTPPPGWPFPAVAFVDDEVSGAGPLGGLLTALKSAEAVLLLACDMPAISEDALIWLLEAWGETDAAERPAGLAVTRQGEPEPFFTIYSRSCVPTALSRMAASRGSLRGLIEECAFPRIEIPPDLAKCLINLNTPDELESYRGRS